MKDLKSNIELIDTEGYDIEYVQRVEKSIQKTFKKEIWRQFTKAINDFKLIEDGDRIAVCVSGGKDSMLTCKLFQELKKHGINNFSVKFLAMDPGYDEKNLLTIKENAKKLNIPLYIFKSNIFDMVDSNKYKGSPCYFCARMRRGHLYKFAKELSCNKIALGHHFDDVIETTLMSVLYSGQFQTMMPKLKSKNYPGMELIRPLYYVHEDDIIRWKNYNNLQFINCACRLTEGLDMDFKKATKRAVTKEIINNLEKDNPIVKKNIFRSAMNVTLPMVLGYKTKDETKSFLDDY